MVKKSGDLGPHANSIFDKDKGTAFLNGEDVSKDDSILADNNSLPHHKKRKTPLINEVDLSIETRLLLDELNSGIT